MELCNQSLRQTYQPSFVVEIASRRQTNQYKEFFEADYRTVQEMIETLEGAIRSDWELCCSDFRYLVKCPLCVCLIRREPRPPSFSSKESAQSCLSRTTAHSVAYQIILFFEDYVVY